MQKQSPHGVQHRSVYWSHFQTLKKVCQAEGFHPQHMLNRERSHSPASKQQEASCGEVLLREHLRQVPTDHQEDL